MARPADFMPALFLRKMRTQGGDDNDHESDGTGDDEEDNSTALPASARAPRRHEPAYLSGHLDALQTQYYLMDSAYMPLIAAKASTNGTGVETSTGIALLELYWAWPHPLHHLVYRTIFLMDLAPGGPHCSDFLLLCIFGIATRHLPSDESEETTDSGRSRRKLCVKQAKTVLLEDMSALSQSIPTIQAYSSSEAVSAL